MISVIIPAFNSDNSIARTIESVLAQTYSDYEIIVVDDGSTDNTAEEVKKFGDKVNYIRQGKEGVSVARNVAIAASKGDWVAFLDADVEWLPNKLQLQKELLDKNLDLSWCGTNYYHCIGDKRNPIGNIERINRALKDKSYFEDVFDAAVKGVCPVKTSTVMIRKNIFEYTGLFEIGRVRQQDLDLWCRIGMLYPKIGFIGQPLSIEHLDKENDILAKRRLLDTLGRNACEVIENNLKLVIENNCLEKFKPFARMNFMINLKMSLFYGNGSEARYIVSHFSDFFSGSFRMGVYALTVFPKVTGWFVRTVFKLLAIIGFSKRVDRRWIYLKTAKKKKKQ